MLLFVSRTCRDAVVLDVAAMVVITQRYHEPTFVIVAVAPPLVVVTAPVPEQSNTASWAALNPVLVVTSVRYRFEPLPVSFAHVVNVY